MDNIKNTLINKKSMEKLISSYIKEYDNRFFIDYSNPITNIFVIHDIVNIQKAFIHKSFFDKRGYNLMNETEYNSCIDVYSSLGEDYERAELLGDKVIDLIVLEFLYDRFPDKDPGFITVLKSRLVRKETLAELFHNLGFKKYVLISCHNERIKGRDNERLYEDMFESFIGMLYKDQNRDLNICRRFLLGVYMTFIDLDDMINTTVDYKTLLLKKFHTFGYNSPVYTTIYHIGPEHSREFTTVVFVNGTLFYKHKISEFILTQKQNEIARIIINDSKKDNITLFIGNDSNTLFSEYIKSIINNKENILLGLGQGETTKAAEQNCSFNCIENLKDIVNKKK